jgi:hypothetical protein
MSETTTAADTQSTTIPLALPLGRDELVIRQRYEVISIVNDILIGLLFLVGSVFFLTPELTHAGTWLFVLGSIDMLIRPVIRLSRRMHLGRYFPKLAAEPASGQDF